MDASFSLVFPGEKKQAPRLQDVYRKAIRRVPRLNAMPPRGGVSFGSQAFRDWASDLEAGKFDDLPTDRLDYWPHYGGYLVLYYTNVFGQHFTQRALEACPDLAPVSEIRCIVEEMAKTCDFAAAGGGFDMKAERLKDRKHMEPICRLIRQAAAFNDRVIDTILRSL